MRGFPTVPMPYPPTWHRDHHTTEDPADLDADAGYTVPDEDPIDRLTDPIETEAAEAQGAAA